MIAPHIGLGHRIAWLTAGAAAFLAMPVAAVAAPPPQAAHQAPAAAPAAPLLQGIVLLAAPGQVRPDGWPDDPHGVDADRLPDLAASGVQQALHGLLGQKITAAVLGNIRKTIEQRLTAAHRPFAAISVPRQQVRGGVVQVLVIEARLGSVRVEGADYFSPAQYRAALRIAPGDPIDTRKLSAATDAINANQYRQAAIVASPGSAVGTTDLTIRAKDRLPVSVNLGFDNTGNNATSLYRVSAGIDWGNAFWRGDDLNYQFSASPDFYLLRQNSLTYTTTLPWGDTLSLSFSYARSHDLPQGPIGSTGVNVDASLRYLIALPPLGHASEHVALGYDFKSTNNNVLFGGETVFPSTSQIDQFVAGIEAAVPDRLGSTQVSLMGFASPGGMTGLNNDLAFSSQQPEARAEYSYARLSVDRMTELPAHFAWHATVTGQISSGILLPSEQLAFGGVQSVRGFVEQGTTRDEGAIWQNEVRAPDMSTGIGQWLGLSRDVLTPFVFLDLGFGGNHNEIAGTPATWVELVSTGPGVTWRFSRYASLRFTWGIPLLREGQVGPLLGPQFGMQAVF